MQTIVYDYYRKGILYFGTILQRQHCNSVRSQTSIPLSGWHTLYSSYCATKPWSYCNQQSLFQVIWFTKKGSKNVLPSQRGSLKPEETWPLESVCVGKTEDPGALHLAGSNLCFTGSGQTGWCCRAGTHCQPRQIKHPTSLKTGLLMMIASQRSSAAWRTWPEQDLWDHHKKAVMANAQLSLRMTKNRKQGGKGAGDTHCVWGKTKYDREQAKTSGAQATQGINGFCIWQPPITSSPDSTSRELVCVTKSYITAQVFAGQEKKVRLINHSRTHLWPSRTDEHLQIVHKHKLPGIPSAWVREEVLLSQWHSAPQVENKIKKKAFTFTEFWNKGLQLLETVLTGCTEHHSGKEAITTLSFASHILHSLPSFPPNDTSTMGLPKYHFLAPLLCPTSLGSM